MLHPPRRAVSRRWSLLACCWRVPAPARADAGWFESGDTQLRIDLQLLNDAEVIRLPLNQWPLPRAAVQYALANAKEHFATNAAVCRGARARARARRGPGRKGALLFDAGDPRREPGLWRDFDTLAREDGELGARAAPTTAGGSRSDLDVTGGHRSRRRRRNARSTVRTPPCSSGNWLLSRQHARSLVGAGARR